MSTVDPLRVPPEMITELAMEIGDPISVAAKYNYSDVQYLQLLSHKWFTRAIEERRNELESEGFSTKAKMAGLAEDLLINAYQAALLSDSASTKLEVAKYLAKIGGLETAANAPQHTAGGFAINIIFRDGGPPMTIESTHAEDITPLPDRLPDDPTINADLTQGLPDYATSEEAPSTDG